MLPKTMRVLVVNVCVLLVAISVIQANQSGQSGSININQVSDCVLPEGVPKAASSCYLKSHGRGFLKLMKEQFGYSLDYILTSKQFGSQYVQRPGMAKVLAEASDRHWEEGMDMLKKFLQRGGDIVDTNYNFKNHLRFSGKPQLTLLQNEDKAVKYVDVLQTMLDNSKSVTKAVNKLYHQAGKSYENGGDADMAHYYDEKIEKEVDVTRELAGHINTLQKMNNLGIAISMFDSNL